MRDHGALEKAYDDEVSRLFAALCVATAKERAAEPKRIDEPSDELKKAVFAFHEGVAAADAAWDLARSPTRSVTSSVVPTPP